MQAEVFLDCIPPAGFTPMGLAVGPNGALFVCSGGRKSRGMVLRIDYAGPPLLDPIVIPTANPELNLVLQAPQPMEAWSRAAWVPEARRLGPGPFVRAATEEVVDPRWRVRAIEILTEVFDGLPQAQADAAARSLSPWVRARVAWSLGCAPAPNPALVLFPLLGDPHPLVRRCALEAIAARLEGLDSPELAGRLAPNLGHPDKAVRLAAAHLASLLSEPSWSRLQAELAGADVGSRLNGLMAQMWRQPGPAHPEMLAPLADLLAQTGEPLFRRDALRLILLALGDWSLQNPPQELYSAYTAAALPTTQQATLNRLRVLTRAVLPSGNAEVDTEAARLLSFLQDADPRVARLLLALIKPGTPVQSDLHWLICFSRQPAWPAELAPRVAEVFLDLDRKRNEAPAHPSESWVPRLTELLHELRRREPKLALLLVNHPRFPEPGHLWLAGQLGQEHQVTAARRYLQVVRSDPQFPWSVPLLDLLAVLPPAEAWPALRSRCQDPVLRDDVLLRLASRPDAADAPLFWEGLSSGRREVAQACVSALIELPPERAGTNLLASFGLLRRLLDQPGETETRATLMAFIEAQTGQKFNVHEPDVPAKPTLTHAHAVRTTYQPVFAWLARKDPALSGRFKPDGGQDPSPWLASLKAAPWAQGDAVRGEQLTVERGCAACHLGGSAPGPNLAGLARRLSTEELFTAIIRPSLEVASPYRPLACLLRDGTTVTGLVLFDSVDEVILQTGPAITIRLPGEDILARQPARVSFMPEGLLEALPPEGLADLDAFLKSLEPRAR
jgi:putative heme-binding domain-containing protein